MIVVKDTAGSNNQTNFFAKYLTLMIFFSKMDLNDFS